MMDKQNNRSFQQMLLPAKERLQHRAPEDIAEKSGAVYCAAKSVLAIKSLNQTLEFAHPEWQCNGDLEEWHHLVILHYFDIADGAPVTADLMPLSGMKDGLIRGTKFDYAVEQELSRIINKIEPDRIRRICSALGARIVDSKADLTAVFPFLPRFPITLNIWFADDEFPASAKMLFHQNADHYFTVEDAVTVGDIMIRKLVNQMLLAEE